MSASEAAAISAKNRAAWPKMIVCAECGKETERRGASQKYCPPCSEAKDLTRKRLWARTHPQKKVPVDGKVLRENCKIAGAKISAGHSKSVCSVISQPDLAWTVKFKVPFTYAASKNHLFAMRAAGHVFMRAESRSFKDTVEAATKSAMRGIGVRQNKYWLDLFVEKTDHKGDAINVLDIVADGVKRGVGIDDRWMCIRRLDWGIQKNNPQIFIGISQEQCEDSQVCSTCGRILPFRFFNKNRHSKIGVGRICADCRRGGRAVTKQIKSKINNDAPETTKEA